MRLGSLCSGYGGLDRAVEAVWPDAELAWVSDIDKGARKVLAHRFPDVPNLGDFTITDWSTIDPVDVLTAGYPCQPFSQAGNRKGTDDVRHIWPHVRQAIRVLRPRITLLENVAGHRSLGFDRVLGDMAEDRMHVRWTSLRAADIGAPHGRERLFIVVTPHPEYPQLQGVGGLSELRGRPNSRPNLQQLLPTPAVNDMGAAYTPETWDAWTAKMQAAHGNGNGHGKSLAIEAQRLLTVRQPEKWGQYAAAIARWETVLGRPAPEPTTPSKKGTPQLSAAFAEWMMGLPAGWITDTPGITRNEAFKLAGNGVVWQQAAAAFRMLLPKMMAHA